MYARDVFVKMQKVALHSQKSYRNACMNEKVAVPLHPQTRQGYPDSLRVISHARSAKKKAFFERLTNETSSTGKQAVVLYALLIYEPSFL